MQCDLPASGGLEAQEEHHVVRMVMPEVHDSERGAKDFAAKTKVLKDLIEHHAGEEEKWRTAALGCPPYIAAGRCCFGAS